MNLHPIYVLVIASLMVPAVVLALMADRALAAEEHGRWTTGGDAADETRNAESLSQAQSRK
jgi:hypothetical protein